MGGSEHPNAVLMRRAYEAFGTGDFDTLSELIAEDATWREAGASLISDAYTGHPGVFEFFGKMFELTAGTFKAEVLDILADDDRVVSIQRSTGERDGRHLDTRDVVATEIRGWDGRRHAAVRRRGKAGGRLLVVDAPPERPCAEELPVDRRRWGEQTVSGSPVAVRETR